MQDRIPEPSWMSDYYGHAPFPGGRIVDRVAVNGAEQPWPANTVRYVSRRWLGPVHLHSQGVEFHIRYVGIHEHEGRGAYPLHTHPHAEFLFTLSGQGSIHVPERKRVEACAPGHLVVLPPGCRHQSRWSAAPGAAWRVMLVDFDIAIDMGKVLVESGETADLAFAPFYEYFFVHQHSGFRLAQAERDPALRILDETARALALRQYGICADIVAGLLRVISLFSRGLRCAGRADGLHLAPPMLSKENTLLKARALLEQSELLDAGCVARIARSLGMSKSHFIREFKQAFGTTPKQYSLDVLMRRAAALMVRTDVIVKEAAFHLGYEDPSSFSRAFHRFFGVSPVEYRRQHQASRP
jgi:AraC-like DNA-binding protein/quercetin dioxygenase-like cupin family protein